MNKKKEPELTLSFIGTIDGRTLDFKDGPVGLARRSITSGSEVAQMLVYEQVQTNGEVVWVLAESVNFFKFVPTKKKNAK